MSDAIVVDLFEGAAGWGVAARELGLSTLGIELDAAPVAVARAAGFRVLQADVAALDPLDYTPCPGVIGSPPCPTFSSAGRGAGRDLEAIILGAIVDLAAGRDTRVERRREAYEALEPDTARFDTLAVTRRCRKREQHAASPADRDRIARREAKRATAKRDAAISLLVVEPLRWALALKPRWVALEQVPPVLPIWRAMAVVLRERGYSVWTGCLSSERYGVPQTRQRAILIASLDREVREPPATHQRYIVPRKRASDGEAATLFAAPEPERIVHREDRDLLPWVSMAEALGMAAGWEQEKVRGAGMIERHGERRRRPVGEPSQAITAGVAGSGPRLKWVSNGQANATTRDVDEPAPTILAGGTSPGEQAWVVETGNFTAVARDADGQRSKAGSVPYARPVDQPSPTIDTKASSWLLRSGQSVAGEGRAERSADDPSLSVISRFDLCEWVGERPSTSVNCDPRVAEPGRDDPAQPGSQYGPATVRVSIEEAAALQSFPPGYPWEAAGTRTAAFRCVGNAVPPLLAWHVLREATGLRR